MTLLASDVTAMRTDDSTFNVADAYLTATWVMVHGSPAWYFNDQFEKGDFVTLETVADYRTNEEYTRLIGVVDCDGTQVTQPAEKLGYTSFSQTQHCLSFSACNPRVICFSPNGEVFPNGITLPFPETFVLDERYGAKWQGTIQQIMNDPLWQTPHTPCGFTGTWGMANVCDTDTDTKKFYAHAPQVEARISLPTNCGLGKNETPPDPFSVFENLAWLDPTTNAYGAGVYAPSSAIGYLDDGSPASVGNLSFQIHAAFADAVAPDSGCRFDYSDEMIL